MKVLLFTLLAQRETGQSEYFMAYALIVAMVVLGMLVVCVPRPRQKHFVKPEEMDAGKANIKKKKRKKR